MVSAIILVMKIFVLFRVKLIGAIVWAFLSALACGASAQESVGLGVNRFDFDCEFALKDFPLSIRKVGLSACEAGMPDNRRHVQDNTPTHTNERKDP